jgi:hypothetical protein
MSEKPRIKLGVTLYSLQDETVWGKLNRYQKMLYGYLTS